MRWTFWLIVVRHLMLTEIIKILEAIKKAKKCILKCKNAKKICMMMLCIVWDGGPEHVKEEHLLCMPPLFSPLQPNGCLETFMAFTNMIIGQFSFCDKNMELCQGKYQHLAVEDKNIQIVKFHRISSLYSMFTS